MQRLNMITVACLRVRWFSQRESGEKRKGGEGYGWQAGKSREKEKQEARGEGKGKERKE